MPFAGRFHTPHNGFIDAQIDGGVVLLALLLGLIALAVVAISQVLSTNPYRAADLAALLALAISQNITEPDFFQSMRPTLLLVAVVASRRTPSAYTSMKSTRTQTRLQSVDRPMPVA